MKNKIIIVFILILSIFMISGCEKEVTKEKTMDELMKLYVEAFTNADVSITRVIFPPFYVQFAKSFMTKEYLEQSLANNKEQYGDDFTITYEIKESKALTAEELGEFNSFMASTFDTTSKASECFEYDGTVTYKGSKSEESVSLTSFKYCKYGNQFYLARY